MEDLLPQAIVWRKDKQGFINPQSEWLKNELRDRVETLLGGDMLITACGLVDQKAVRQLYWAYCQQGSTNGAIWYKDVFNPIALEIWARQFEPYLRF